MTRPWRCALLQMRVTVCRRRGSQTAALGGPAAPVPLPAVTLTAWRVCRNVPIVTRRPDITGILANTNQLRPGDTW